MKKMLRTTDTEEKICLWFFPPLPFNKEDIISERSTMYSFYEEKKGEKIKARIIKQNHVGTKESIVKL